MRRGTHTPAAFRFFDMRSVLAAAAATAAVAARLADDGGGAYDVRVISRPPRPVLSYLDGTTAWPQSFNPSWVEASAGTKGKSGLLVRAQNCTRFTPGVCVGCNVDPHNPIPPSAPDFPGSVITFAEQLADGSFAPPYLVFAPEGAAEAFGTEDPRLRFDPATGLYHLFYTCYGAPGPFLCHATTGDPTAPYPGAWTRLGAVNGIKDSKSAALLVRPAPPHYLLWGAGVIHLAVSEDLLNFTTVNSSWIVPRPEAFDSDLVEAGPPPLPLSDGNLLFFYNSANWTADHKDFDAYNPAYVILSGADPSVILQRADVPLLSPDHGWEQGTAPFECNVHNVRACGAGGGQPAHMRACLRGLAGVDTRVLDRRRIGFDGPRPSPATTPHPRPPTLPLARAGHVPGGGAARALPARHVRRVLWRQRRGGGHRAHPGHAARPPPAVSAGRAAAAARRFERQRAPTAASCAFVCVCTFPIKPHAPRQKPTTQCLAHSSPSQISTYSRLPVEGHWLAVGECLRLSLTQRLSVSISLS